ncbi:RICIN domain-containing protein [Amycolatopsis albispora]|uniref:Ricin B lectin domain-containing protein n=1 Tax=Amycolatopsis albispora TaxID=1804986 RepID=A0A344L2N5_9PSEU|nr:RICIN domain-containing protein [Amycolatopsis albispora]AXB42309.1 hypothetical protein A4R43_07010 [Amycolatopsis albispora]
MTTILAALAALGTSAALPASAGPLVGNDPFVAPAGRQDWHIFNANTHKCLEIENSTLDNGGQAQQWSCANIATMRWTAVPVDGIWFRLINANSGKCLEIENSSFDNGGNAQQWTCGSYNMQWRTVRAGYAWHIVNRLSGKCLEIENSSGDNGARAQQWQCADIPTMQWFS